MKDFVFSTEDNVTYTVNASDTITVNEVVIDEVVKAKLDFVMQNKQRWIFVMEKLFGCNYRFQGNLIFEWTNQNMKKRYDFAIKLN